MRYLGIDISLCSGFACHNIIFFCITPSSLTNIKHISEEYIASCWSLALRTLRPRVWRPYNVPELRLNFLGPLSILAQTMEFFKVKLLSPATSKVMRDVVYEMSCGAFEDY
jgi:hypothetical protein